MDFSDIYSVDREDYKTFLEQINRDSFNIETVRINKWAVASKVISKKTGKCLCSRVQHEVRVEGQEREPEQYYIFCDPDPDERQQSRPKLTLKLETPQEVQAFLKILDKLKEDKNHD